MSAALPEEWSVLLHTVAEESLSADQERRLAELLRADAAFRREYVRHCQLLALLTWECATPTPAPADPPPASSRQPAGTAGAPVRSSSPRGAVAERPRRHRIWVAAMGVVIVLVAALSWRGLARVAPGRVTGVAGEVRIERGGQPPVVLSNGVSFALHDNDSVHTGQNSRAKLVLADGTECDVKPGTRLTLVAAAARTIQLEEGNVAARVAPQPAGHPLTFVTPRAEIRVLGTVLEVLALDRQTEVAVSEGKVQVTRTSDRASAEVSAGQFTSVAETGALAVVDWPRPPDAWSEDFEEGLPTGWTGRLVAAGLPAGSRGAAQAVPSAERRGVELSSSTTQTGLFAWHDDSVLQLTFRISPPAWFHVCLSVRACDPSRPVSTYCWIDPDLWQSKPGEWRTVRIPLSEFRPTSFERPEPTLGRIPVRIAFVGPRDLAGVAIDRIRVERRTSAAGNVPETAGN